LADEKNFNYQLLSDGILFFIKAILGEQLYIFCLGIYRRLHWNHF